MAETVLSMARSLLGSVVSKAASVAADEMSLMLGVRKEMWFIKDELKTIQAFLIAAETMEKKDLLLKVWVEQVRDLSYDIEDCLDEFMVHVGSQTRLQRLKKLKDRHRIADQIRNLKSRVEEVSSRNARYNFIKVESSNTAAEIASNMEAIRNYSASNIDEAELVGFSKPKRELVQLMDVTTMDGPAKTICVVGTGGLGKTTLARKTYESKEDILKTYPYRAWVTVSQNFSKRAMLEDTILQFFGSDALQKLLKRLAGKMSEEGLASYLREELKDKRYFIVFDDLWEKHDWDWIYNIALPRNSSRGSRIVVTTRDVGLAMYCSTSEQLIYHLKPLELDDAIELLLRKTKIGHEHMEKEEKLRDIVTRLVKKCGHLPLAILTIGGILATEKTSEWENFYKKLPSELESNPSLEAVRRMVTLSYNHLPFHLKPCFLYLSIFPEDFEIKRRHLVDRWIAEGFVRARVGMTIVDVGESYFNELMNRSMILPSELNIEGNIKSCRVHDIMRDVIVSFSREENFACFIQGNRSNLPAENFRHFAFLDSQCPEAGMDWSHIRSLTLFTRGGSMKLDLTASVCSPKLRMLRVLDLVGYFRITQNGMNSVMLLRHLKYLKVRASPSLIYSLPSSIGKIKDLQILDIGSSYITTLPTEITKLRNLRSIRCYRIGFLYCDCRGQLKACLLGALLLPIIIANSYGLCMGCSNLWSFGVRVPRGIANLKELLVLEAVDIRRTSSKAIQEIGELGQLRKLVLSTKGASKKKCNALGASIEHSSLRSLSVTDDGDRGLGWLVSSSFPPPHLRSLRLRGYIGEVMADWFRNLTQLMKLRLSWSQLKEEKTMEILGELPELLLLRFAYNSYLGEKLVFGTGAFRTLRNLEIGKQDGLIEMKFEEGASPQMERIEISHCRLVSGIIGIKHLPKLKEISLGYESQVARLGMLEDEVNTHPNRPILRLVKDRNYHDLGDARGSNVEVEATESSADHTGESSQVIVLPTTDSEIQPASS